VQVLDGIAVSAHLREHLKQRIDNFRQRRGRPPGLSVILVGENPASQIYVRNKEKACHDVGIESRRHDLPADISFEKLKTLVEQINRDESVDGLLIQLPLPSQLEPAKIIDLVDPRKDVDCLTRENMGLLFAGLPRVRTCTPYGCMKILEHYKIPVSGKNAVVIGRSNIVGKPVAMLLLEAGATVTVCHSKTRDLRAHTTQADILVAAVGKAGMIGRDDVKKGAVVIDVGINRLPNGKITGDVRFPELEGWASAATPVPKGVGPMTITMLLHNTLELAELRNP
jgi:methylenetetrahydrofolate dehydrogenase (NADP+)/methenyltetrahydrofolate cyclohydrolase